MHNSLFPDELNRQTIAIKEQRYQLWVGSVSPPRQIPVLHQGLDAINWRVPGLDGEAVTCVVDH